ncbi:helix-turn-helix domain-containing protein [Clostridium sulfidigenes]|uniref:helix-turn-helix domain-containing protein n=1 Tax=Clostridium sulfidigenes TaxID=318464 RepID=UPI003F8B2743
MDFSKVVKAIRKTLDISQEQLAKELHVSFATINRWENGKNSPNMLERKALYDYSKEMGIDLELLKKLMEC